MHCPPSSDSLQRRRGGTAAAVPEQHSQETPTSIYSRVEQLNGYIKYLPTVHDSRQAAATSKPAAPYDEAELAGMLLRMCPDTWQDHYATTQQVVPQDS